MKTYIPLLAKSGILCKMGAVGAPHQFSQIPLMFTISGSLVGGLADNQECVDFCAKHKIYPDCEIIDAKQLDWAF